MSSRRVFYDALAIGGLWGLVDVVFSFTAGTAPARDAVPVFFAPIFVTLAYHGGLLAVSRVRPYRLVDLLISAGFALPPLLFLYGSRGQGGPILLSVGVLTLVLGLVLVVLQWRQGDERGWLTPLRLPEALALYSAAAAAFVLSAEGAGLITPTMAGVMASWLGASAVVLVLVVSLARRWAGPLVFAALCLCSLAVALQRSPALPTYRGDSPERNPPRPARPGAPNVLLIVLDTVRADHLDLYGYARPTFAETSRYLRDGLVFDRATSSGTFSLTSHGSLFSGLLPSAHGAYPTLSGTERYGRMWKDIPTLAEELQRRGYRTVGVSANFAFLGEWTGFQRGFDDFQVSPVRRSRFRSLFTRIRRRLEGTGMIARVPVSKTAKEISDAAITITGQTRSPFFLFLNYFDAHAPHEFTGSPPWASSSGPDPIEAYDSEIAHLDSEIARLLHTLEERGQLDHTLVILTADHGEYFKERGLRGHPPAPYEGSIHVPLALRLKGVVPPGRSGRRTGLHEVYRMALDVADQRSLDWLSQVDLTPRILNEAWSPKDYEKPAPKDGRPSTTVVFAGNLKLIHRLSGGSELFDLETDPGEERNLIDSDDPRVVKLKETMIGEVTRRVVRGPGPAAALSDDAKERLRALGYLR